VLPVQFSEGAVLCVPAFESLFVARKKSHDYADNYRAKEKYPADE
jgi:hypothetical protein